MPRAGAAVRGTERPPRAFRPPPRPQVLAEYLYVVGGELRSTTVVLKQAGLTPACVDALPTVEVHTAAGEEARLAPRSIWADPLRAVAPVM